MSGDAGARRRAAGEYVRALFGPAPEGSLVEVRFRVPSGMAQRFVPASRERDMVDAVLSLASRTEVFVGVLPRARLGGRITDVVRRSSVLWADCDTSASAAALASFGPCPSMVVASGSGQHLHAYWFLQEPVDLDRLEQLNRRLAAALGADGWSRHQAAHDSQACGLREQKALAARLGAPDRPAGGPPRWR